MNSPVWVRKNIGKENIKPGLPYSDSKAFSKWIAKHIGKPDKTTPVIFGLTIDCCVLSTIQEFSWRGYKPIVIREAVDHASGKKNDRDVILEKTAIRWWAKVMSWRDFLALSNARRE